MTDARSLLSSNVDDFERPPLLPVGTYQAVVADWQPEQSAKGRDMCTVSFNIIAPTADVDMSSFSGDVSTRKMRQNFMLDKDNMWRLKTFLTETLGIPGSRPTNALLEEAKGKRCRLLITKRMDDQNNEQNQIKQILAAE